MSTNANLPRRWPAITFYICLGLISASIGGLVSLAGTTHAMAGSLIINLSRGATSLSILSLEVFIVVLAFGLSAFALAESREDFVIISIILLLVVASPIFAFTHVWHNELSFFILLLSFTVTVSLFSIASRALSGDWISAVIQISIPAWSALTVFVKLSGHLDFFHPEAAVYPRPLWFLVSSRTFIGVLALGALLLGAIRWLRREEVPPVTGLPPFPILSKNSPEGFLLILYPFVFTARLSIAILVSILDIFWQLMAYTAIYIFMFSAALIAVLSSALNGYWPTLLRFTRAVLAYALAILLAEVVQVAATSISAYIYSSETRVGPWAQWPDLSGAGLFLICIFLGTIAFTLLLLGWSKTSQIATRSGFGGATIFVTCIISGIPLYLLNNFEFINLYGFGRLGLLSVLIGSLFLITLALVAVSWLFDKEEAKS